MQEKFNKFYQKYENFMFHIANGVLKDNYLAEDAVQTAFINMYKNFQGVDDIDSIQTKHFVITVTKRAAIDIYRRQKRQNMREPSLEEFDEGAEDLQMEFLAENNVVMECINKIPKKYADVLMLKYVNGYRTKEIAEVFGNTPATVRSYIFRGKKLLREELKKNGIDIKI